MKTSGLVKTLLATAGVIGMTMPVYAQRGTGEPEGMARRAAKPPIEQLQGTVQKIITEECENTTGRARVGAHFILRTAEGETRNVHLGPATAPEVKAAVDALSEGQAVTVRGFRTDRMPAGHYNAVKLESADQTVVLRRADLRPLWAGQGGGDRWERRGSPGTGRGWGRGCGRGGAWGQTGDGRGFRGGRAGRGGGPANCPRWGR